MKLFISWSGEFSQRVAEKLSIWIPTIIQSVEVFYSPDDIAKGENWSNRLSEELDDCSFGIICLTPENVAAPWVHFEAGALSKSLDTRVSAIMLNISPSNVKGPLAHYQNTAFERKDFFRLFQSINKSSEAPLRPDILKNAFDNAWDKMHAEIEEIISIYANLGESATTEDRSASDSDAVQEILRLVRKIDSSQTPFSKPGRNSQFRHDNECNPSNEDRQVCVVDALSADPLDVFSIVNDYFPNEESRKIALGALQASGKFACLLPTSEVQQVLTKLNAIGAAMSGRYSKSELK